ncbi:MAG: shikimate dehydrogenase [Deltaproteobacteria bacterium]|nr:shikimate dehydrogenase [Deltaproteobacteria bacterium]
MTATRVPLAATTRIVAVIGDPIAHSRSPLMHNAAFRALGLDFAYGAFRVRPDDVGAAVAAVRALGLAGLNVTIPHKQAVIPHLDVLSPVARATGAVNTIVNRDGVLRGDNTDVPGLSLALDESGLAPRAKLAIVLGAGGSARATVVALARRTRTVVVAARRAEQARALLDELGPVVRARLLAVRLDALADARGSAAQHLAAADVVLNTTPVGMHGEPFLPFAFAATSAGCLFYDLVYTARVTPFLAAAHRARRRGVNGLGMLLHQGAVAFELWTGVSPPLEVMRRALRSAASPARAPATSAARPERARPASPRRR